MTLNIPLWVIVTVLYVVALGIGVRKSEDSGGMLDLSPLVGCLWFLAATVAYLLYWILELAL